ncbi:TerD family protein [Massilia sp. PAMC28688]|uniref:TerD family protein n=1 Tax=Massilia sp. PAMC28688 TaxID=2861283 RepID=UPI001C633CF4|nr:TerD family protein [Massilia sp. PAMC28688]QYF92591.1 TerD family protein [Massilia sp. PAMC28688]
MSTTLETGHRINLEKTAPGLKRVRIGLGWKVNATDGAPFDLDSSVFLCKKNAADDPVMLSNAHFVYYNQTTSPDGAVVHSGDNRTGDVEGDDEVITVDLARVEPSVVELPIIVTIHDAEARRQNFGRVNGAYVKVYNDETGEELVKYDLNEDYSDKTALQFGSLYRKDGEWRFQAVGAGFKLSLATFIRKLGGTV